MVGPTARLVVWCLFGVEADGFWLDLAFLDISDGTTGATVVFATPPEVVAAY